MVTVAANLSSAFPDVTRREETLIAQDGVTLAIEHFGDGKNPAVVFAHGFGQTRHAWDGTASALARAGWHTVTADARGHGDSDRCGDGNYHYDQFVDDLVRVARGSGETPVLVGASMGGLLGLAAQALHAPFSALVLVDITPRWEARGVERILAFMRAHPEGFVSVEQAQAAIASYLPHRAQTREPTRLNKLLVRGADGRLRWHWDPRLLDTVALEVGGMPARLADAAKKLQLPVLLISGGRSDVVSEATIAEFRALVPHAEHVAITDATHMVAGDSNARFTGEIAAFLDRLAVAPSSSGAFA